MPPALPRSLALLALAAAALAQPAEPVFERLGVPIIDRELTIGAATHDPDGYDFAWGMENVRGQAQHALIGIRLDTGEVVRHDLSRYGASTSTVFTGADGNAYLYVGSPAHFLRYHAATREVEDLGVPTPRSSYFPAAHLDHNGIAWIGTYPTTTLVWVNTHTGEIGSLGRVSDDPKQSYALSTAVADDGTVYAAAGLHHMELWAIDPATKEKRQILPASLTEKQGSPTVFRGKDGQVYGRGGGLTFRCRPDGIEPVEAAEAAWVPRASAGGWTLGNLDDDGALLLTHQQTNEKKTLPTQYPGRPAVIHSVAAERDGVIYGSSLLPGNLFSYNTRSGELTDHGVITTGPFQVYDIASLPQGLFLSSYMGCHIDLFRPDQPLAKGENPRYLGRATAQERPIQWCLGPDGKLYTGTVPSKGRLGGAIMQIEPETGTIRQFDNVIPNQSVMYLATVPDTRLLFGCASVQGGSSAVPVEKEAVCFLWDTGTQQVVWQGRPLPGATAYGRAVLARNGPLYGVAGNRFYVFDPARRETVATGDLPVRGLSFPTLHDEPVGDRGLIVGIGDGAVVALDPATNQASILAQHPSLSGVHGFMADSAGTLYYGSKTELWRGRLAW